MKKRKGEVSINIVLVLSCIIILWLLIAYMMQIHTYHAIATKTEDALAASNLASAVIDVAEYGVSHNIVIWDAVGSYEIYKDALKINMGLDESWNSIESSDIINGPIVVLEYVVYNVVGEDVEEIHFGERFYQQVIPGGKGSVTAPDGTVIESTSIYSKITFPVKGIFNIQTMAVKDQLVDIVS